MFSLDNFNIVDIKARDLLDGHSPRRSWASTIMAGTAAAASLLGSAHTFADPTENATRLAREQHACAVIMGLTQPGELYDACVRSLDNSLSELDQARLVSTDRLRCAKEGLKRRTPAFAECVVDSEEAPANPAGKGGGAAAR